MPLTNTQGKSENYAARSSHPEITNSRYLQTTTSVPNRCLGVPSRLTTQIQKKKRNQGKMGPRRRHETNIRQALSAQTANLTPGCPEKKAMPARQRCRLCFEPGQRRKKSPCRSNHWQGRVSRRHVGRSITSSFPDSVVLPRLHDPSHTKEQWASRHLQHSAMMSLCYIIQEAIVLCFCSPGANQPRFRFYCVAGWFKLTADPTL